MADRTVLTVQTLFNLNTDCTPSATDLDLSWDAADVANKNRFIVGDKDLVLAWNTDGVNPYTITLSSVADVHGRTGDVTAYSILADTIAAVYIPKDLFRRSSDGYVYLEANNAAVEFAIVRAP